MTPEEKVLTLLGIMDDSFDPLDHDRSSDFDLQWDGEEERELSPQQIASGEAKEAIEKAPANSVYKFGWYNPDAALDDDDAAEWETISGERVLVTDITHENKPPEGQEVYFKGLVTRCTRMARLEHE